MRPTRAPLITLFALLFAGCADSVPIGGYDVAPFCDGRSRCGGDAESIDLDGDRCADRCEVPTCETFAPVVCGDAMPVDLDGDGCARECPPATTGDSCGGIVGMTCEAGELCDYALADRCGYADAIGTCRPIPEACTEEYAPVCGCDGETYGNECAAHAAGVAVASWGPCAMACPAYYPICEGGAAPIDADGDGCALECPTSPMSCGGLTPEGPITCPSGTFCDYDPSDDCGFTDAPGECRVIPDVCTEEYAPVCGCDGQTYTSRCKAASAQVGILHEGPCD